MGVWYFGDGIIIMVFFGVYIYVFSFMSGGVYVLYIVIFDFIDFDGYMIILVIVYVIVYLSIIGDIGVDVVGCGKF